MFIKSSPFTNRRRRRRLCRRHRWRRRTGLFDCPRCDVAGKTLLHKRERGGGQKEAVNERQRGRSLGLPCLSPSPPSPHLPPPALLSFFVSSSPRHSEKEAKCKVSREREREREKGKCKKGLICYYCCTVLVCNVRSCV